jgi:hypothetical protein
MVNRRFKKVTRAADAKEVGMGNPAEETCYHPNRFECGQVHEPSQRFFLDFHNAGVTD